MDKLIFKSAATDKIIIKDSVLVLYHPLNNRAEIGLNRLAKKYNFALSDRQKALLIKDAVEVGARSKNEFDVAIFPFKIDDKLNSDFFRNHLCGILESLKRKNYSSINLLPAEFEAVKNYFVDEEYYLRSALEGIWFGNYAFDKFKSDRKKATAITINLIYDKISSAKKAISITENIMSGVFFARDLQNEPAINLTPDLLARRVKKTLSSNSISVKIFDEKQVAKMKMGGLLGVGMGSENPPRFIVGHYKSKSNSANKKIAIVGKGVTFDSGGISIKPAQNMGMMKADMSGAAVVAGILLAAAKSKLPFEIYGIIPAAENMVSGKAMRPGDIIATSSGKTIEVDNTDAEGRMILADALHYASQLKPDLIIDLATLTGACAVALGEFTAGLFSKTDSLADELFQASQTTYDRIWPLPMWDEYHSLNKSDVADVKNVGGRWGGAITAAKFLENWVDKNIPWAHLDIAGPAMPNTINNYSKTFMTGFGVRLLFEFLKEKK